MSSRTARAALYGAAVLALVTRPAQAAILDHASIVTIAPSDVITELDPLPAGSGAGLLDVVLFAPSGGGSLNNPAGALNFDNSNTEMPTGVASIANESYLTSMGELRDFARLNFPDGLGGSTLTELALFLDLDESAEHPSILLTALDVIVDYSIPSGVTAQNPAANDITATIQNAVNGTFASGDGTRLVRLGNDPVALSRLSEGAALDAVIPLGLNPFAAPYGDEARVLIHWGGEQHDGAGERIWLSGALGLDDLLTGPPLPPLPDDQPGEVEGPVTPEPASLALMAMGAIALAMREWRAWMYLVLPRHHRLA